MKSLLLSILVFSSSFLLAQYTGYSLKLGSTIGIQQWNDFDREPLFGYHADLQIENISDDEARTLFASVGFHQRGSATRFNFLSANGTRIRNTTKFIFNNAVLVLGGKQLYPLGEVLQGHVSIGVRGEVNVSSSFGEDGLADNNPGILLSFPQEDFINRFLYGVDIGAGIDFPLSPSFDGLVEIRLSPDLSRQYFQPPFVGPDLFQIGNVRNYPERRISNVSIELSLGIRFVNYASFEE